MKIKVFIMFAVTMAMLAATGAAFPRPTEAPIVEDTGVILFDTFNRDEITKGGFDNEQGLQVYWISSTKNNPVVTMENGAVKLEFAPQGWYGEGAAVKDPDYRYLVMRMKGETGGEGADISLKFDSTSTFLRFTEVVTPTGEHPVLTTEFSDIVIDVAASGFPVTETGWEAIHLNTYDNPATIWIDEIYLTKDIPERHAGAFFTSEEYGVIEAPPVVEEKTVTLEELEGIEQDIMLFDNFMRDMITKDSMPNADDGMIYWTNWETPDPPEVDGGALKLVLPPMGWYGEGASVKDPRYRFLTFRIRGERGGEGEFFTLKFDNSDIFVKFADLIGVDGEKVPAITTDWQNITFDLSQNGFDWNAGFEAIHLNTKDVGVTIWIDEIYLSTLPPENDGKRLYATGAGGYTGGEVAVLSQNPPIPPKADVSPKFSFAPGFANAQLQSVSAGETPGITLIAGMALAALSLCALVAGFILRKGGKSQ